MLKMFTFDQLNLTFKINSIMNSHTLRLRSLLLICLFCLGLGTSYSQVELGAKIGYNLSKLQLDSLPAGATVDYMAGFEAGVAAKIRLFPYIALQPELLYTNKGAIINFFNDTTYTLNTTYLEAPILLRGCIPLGKKVSVYLNAGANASWLLDKSAVISQAQTQITQVDLDSLAAEIQTLDFGVNFGAGLGWKVGPGRFILDGRYQIGLQELLSSNAADLLSGAQSRMTGFSLSYLIGFGSYDRWY